MLPRYLTLCLRGGFVLFGVVITWLLCWCTSIHAQTLTLEEIATIYEGLETPVTSYSSDTSIEFKVHWNPPEEATNHIKYEQSEYKLWEESFAWASDNRRFIKRRRGTDPKSLLLDEVHVLKGSVHYSYVPKIDRVELSRSVLSDGTDVGEKKFGGIFTPECTALDFSSILTTRLSYGKSSHKIPYSLRSSGARIVADDYGVEGNKCVLVEVPELSIRIAFDPKLDYAIRLIEEYNLGLDGYAHTKYSVS